MFIVFFFTKFNFSVLRKKTITYIIVIIIIRIYCTVADKRGAMGTVCCRPHCQWGPHIDFHKIPLESFISGYHFQLQLYVKLLTSCIWVWSLVATTTIVWFRILTGINSLYGYVCKYSIQHSKLWSSWCDLPCSLIYVLLNSLKTVGLIYLKLQWWLTTIKSN